MSRRNKIIIAIAVILGILAIVLIVLSLGEKAPLINKGVGRGEIGPEGALPLINRGAEVTLPVPPQEAGTASVVTALAMSFAERFGSFSNQANFENLQDLKVLMTPKMISWTDNYILESKAKGGASDVYSGITTKALSTRIVSLEEDLGRAEIIVTTQRQQAEGTTSNPTVYYQNLLLKLVKLAEAWKVDEATWQ